MSAGNSHIPAAAHNLTGVPRSHFSAPESAVRPQGVMHVESAEIDNSVQNLQDSLRAELYLVLQSARVDMFERNAVLLRAAIINDHSTEHQDRDAYMVMRLFEMFPHKLHPKFLEPVVAASMVHDREYIPAARAHAMVQLERLQNDFNNVEGAGMETFALFKAIMEMKEAWKIFLRQLDHLEHAPLEDIQDIWKREHSFPKGIGKHELDPHAELGDVMMREWVELEEMAPGFRNWDEEQREVAALTIRDHSNGSAFDPYSSPLAAQVLRLADKLDNTYRRVPGMLNRESLSDPNNCHRFVPAAIREMALTVDHDTKTFTVDYTVNPSIVETAMHEFDAGFVYGKERFLVDFEQAYGRKSMRIAAEVTDKLFADDAAGEFYSKDAVFQVRLSFPDGTQHIQMYKRLPTPPGFN